MSIKAEEKPDIAFYFDRATGLYLVKVHNGVTLADLLLASFDLLSKALKEDARKPVMEWNIDDEK